MPSRSYDCSNNTSHEPHYGHSQRLTLDIAHCPETLKTEKYHTYSDNFYQAYYQGVVVQANTPTVKS